MKLNNKQIEEIRKLFSEGKDIYELAALFKVHRTTISYNLTDDVRMKRIKHSYDCFKRKSKEQRSAIYKQRLPYMTKYHRIRYQSDPIFRFKQIERSKEYQKRKRELK